MDTRQLEAFLRVARAGRLGQAAAELYVTQPALTARIQRLEQDLGGLLFVRSKRGMRLTAAGRAFVPFAARALESVEEGRSLVRGISHARSEALTIGSAPAVGTYVLPRLLEGFARAHPQVALSVRTGHSEEVLEMVLREEVEVGLIRAVAHPDVIATLIYEDEMVLVAAPTHRFARTGTATLADLARERLIMFDPSSSYHDLTSNLLRSARVTPQATMELDSSEGAANMVEHGLGVALLPRSAVAGGLEAARLREIALFGVRLPRRPIVAIQRGDTPPTAAAAAFVAAVRGDSAP